MGKVTIIYKIGKCFNCSDICWISLNFNEEMGEIESSHFFSLCRLHGSLGITNCDNNLQTDWNGNTPETKNHMWY